MIQYDVIRDLPPTAGMPLFWRDLLPGDTHFAEAVGTLFTLPTPQLECSGTASLIIILTTLAKNNPRTRVIIPAYTCPLVVLAIAHCKLEIILCDLAPESIDFDLQQLETLINATNYKDTILAVIPTHLAGRVSNIDAVKKTIAAHNIFIIEDAAQALGARVNGQSVGLMGDAGFFSFAIGKGLNLYEGGLLISQDENLRKKFLSCSRNIVPTNLWLELRRSFELLVSSRFYNPTGLTYVYGKQFRRYLKKNDWISAVGDFFSHKIPLHRVGRWRKMVGLHALPRLPDFIQQTQRQAHARITQLQTLNNLIVIMDSPGINAEGTWPLLMLLMPSEAIRDQALTLLADKGLGVSRLFVYALPDYKYLQPYLTASVSAEIPNAKDLAARMLTLTNSLWLSDADFAIIYKVLQKLLS